MHKRPDLILASSSRYRRELLARLKLPFKVVEPSVNEDELPGESPRDTCLRLAMAKAAAVAVLHPHAVVIGSDQVADVDGRAISKPGTHEAARAQLQSMRGRTLVFHTAVAVVCQATAYAQSALVPISVTFRRTSDAEIERYLELEQPYDCAGSVKSEGLGIAMLEAVVSDDASALIGLPLIQTCKLLRAAGLDPMQP